MQFPLISVIVPIYRVEEYISPCVESLLRQTYPNVELILVDDGSDDGCPAICDRFAAEHAHIRVIHQENRGLSGARNTGIDAAKGELLCFVDSDDTVAPEMLERLYALMCESGAAIASSGIEKGARIDGVFTPEQAIKGLLKEQTNLSTCAWGKLYQRELFDDLRYPEGVIYEDFALTPLLFDRAGRIAHTGDILYCYREDNTTGITHSRFTPKRLEYFAVSDEIEAFLQERYPHLLRDAENRRTRNAIGFFRQMAQTGSDDKQTRRTLVRETRRGILPYLFSAYKLKSKAYGLLIAACPPLARRIKLS